MWECFYEQELSHLHKAAELLGKYENKQWQQVIPDGNFPELLCFHENIDYIRDVLKNTVTKTSYFDEYPEIDNLPDNAKYFFFQSTLNRDVSCVPSHQVIDKYIREKGMDYRFEVAEHPVPELRNRKIDNTSIARCKNNVCVG